VFLHLKRKKRRRGGGGFNGGRRDFAQRPKAFYRVTGGGENPVRGGVPYELWEGSGNTSGKFSNLSEDSRRRLSLNLKKGKIRGKRGLPQ